MDASAADVIRFAHVSGRGGVDVHCCLVSISALLNIFVLTLLPSALSHSLLVGGKQPKCLAQTGFYNWEENALV